MKHFLFFVCIVFFFISCGLNNASSGSDYSEQYRLIKLQHDSMENDLKFTEKNYLQMKSAFDSLKMAKSEHIDSLIHKEDSLIQLHRLKVAEHAALLQENLLMKQKYKNGNRNLQEMNEKYNKINQSNLMLMDEHKQMKANEKLIYEILRRDLEAIRKSNE